jgi:hypothetical protein
VRDSGSALEVPTIADKRVTGNLSFPIILILSAPAIVQAAEDETAD